MEDACFIYVLIYFGWHFHGFSFRGWAPRYQLPCGTPDHHVGVGRASHTCRVVFEHVKFCFVWLVVCLIPCAWLLPFACLLLMLPCFFLGSFFPGAPPSLICLLLHTRPPIKRSISSIIFQATKKFRRGASKSSLGPYWFEWHDKSKARFDCACGECDWIHRSHREEQ